MDALAATLQSFSLYELKRNSYTIGSNANDGTTGREKTQSVREISKTEHTSSRDGMTHASAGGLLLEGGAVNSVIRLCRTEVKASTYDTSKGDFSASAASPSAVAAVGS